MYIFLITFLSVYGGMHLYAFLRIRGAFLPGANLCRALSAWMLLMTFAPLLVRTLERAGMEQSALAIAWPGYIWMGFIFIFASLLLVFDLIRCVCRLSTRFFFPSAPVIPDSRVLCELALLLAVAASGYSIHEARQIRVERITLSTPKLPENIGKIRIVQISDVHIGLLYREKRLESVLKAVREAKPDIIVSTGDLVDGKLNREGILSNRNSMAEMIASVPAPGGRFAVTGNHESYAGLRQALDFSADAGFTVLRNLTAGLQNGVTITGVDDPTLFTGTGKSESVEKELLGKLSKKTFNILLKHRPEIPAANDGMFDLQLSGHVHGGQIFPFNFLVKFKYPIPCGTTRTKAGSQIHVSRGTGTWGPPMRLFAPPEVTVIDIVQGLPPS